MPSVDALAAGLDAHIDARVRALEARIRADLAATGPADEALLDQPVDPDAAWRLISVEEVLEAERARLEAVRDHLLVVFG